MREPGEDEDLEFPEDRVPVPPRMSAAVPTAGSGVQAQRILVQAGNPQADMRGVGEAHVREPIAAVVEVLRRKPCPDGKWEIMRPFGPKVEGAKYAFAVMTARTTHTIKRGSFEVPARDAHPLFAAFNSCHPDLACTLTCKIIHWNEADAWRFFLGAFQHPEGKKLSPPTGWWCKGDAKKAVRWVDGKWKNIVCPHRMCEFSQPTFGPAHNQPYCKPNLTLLAQFNWKNEKSMLPRSIFQWDSKSWNNYSNAAGLFKLVRETAEHLGMTQFPVFGLPFVMNVRETAKKGRLFPEVTFSPDGDLMEWFGTLAGARQLPAGEVVKPLQLAPPEGYTQDDMDRATQATLDGNYRPANERGT